MDKVTACRLQQFLAMGMQAPYLPRSNEQVIRQAGQRLICREYCRCDLAKQYGYSHLKWLDVYRTVS
jgi:hypothetical protein